MSSLVTLRNSATRSPSLLYLAAAALVICMFVGLASGQAAPARAAAVTDTRPPTAPPWLRGAAASGTLIGLSWGEASDDVAVFGYDIYLDGSRIRTTGALSASVSDLTCGTSYTFAVDAYDAAGNRSPTAEATVATTSCPEWTDARPPTAPPWLQAMSVGGTLIGLSWGDATDDVAVAGYDLWENGNRIVTTGALSASVSGLTCGTSYTFAVDAYDAVGNRSPTTGVTVSTASCTDTQPPTAPPWLQATSISGTSIGLSWGSATDDMVVGGYEVWENGSRIVTTRALSASVSGLTCGTNYTFGVDAFDPAGNRSPRTEATVATASCPEWTDAQAPTAPPWLEATSVSSSLVGLSWGDASDDVAVVGYDLWQDGDRITTTGALSASVSGLTCGTRYTFAVDAYDAVGNRSPTTAVTVATADCPPPTTEASVYWGALIEGPQTYGSLYGGTWTSAPWCDAGTQCALDRFTQNAGKRPSIEQWGQGPPWDRPFDAESMNLAVSRGDIPALDMSTGNTSLLAIADGDYDNSLIAWAEAAKAWGHPFFLVLDEEMNGRWYGYSPGQNGNTAADFVNAWRHMHDVFDAVGATNVTWVWCPNVNVYGDFPMDNLYPGDAYVDWTGLVGYDWGGSDPADWLTFSALYGSSYDDLVQLAPSKPIFIAEIAANEEGGSKADWITDALTIQLPHDFPEIKAFVWFNWRIYEKNQYWPWNIESSPSALQAFRDGIGLPYYAAGGSFGNLPLLSKVNPLR
jgi:chitodextrinase